MYCTLQTLVAETDYIAP